MRKIFKEDATPTQKVLRIVALGLVINYYNKNKKLPTTLIVLLATPFVLESLNPYA